MEDKKEGLLAGIRVLDLADEKVSFCSKVMADLGARVIKIERPGGDPSRRVGPFSGDFPHPERSLFFCHNNTNKLGITLDIEKEEGKGLFLKLLKKTDVVVETFQPGYLDKIGLGFDVLGRIHPEIVLVSVTGFGGSGRRSSFKSCDLVASASGGQMYVSGSPSTPPLKPFGEQPYYTASMFAAISTLLALRQRDRTGKGDHIDISLQEAAVSTLDHVMVRFFYEKVIAKRQGSLYWNNSFCILPCKDGHILIAPFQQWETLVEWMESEGMAEDLKEDKHRQEGSRFAHVDHIIEVLKRWTRSHTMNELFDLGQALRFPWSPVFSPEEVLNSPQLRARDFFMDMEHPGIEGRVSCPGPPYRFSRASSGRWKRAPLVGEDNVRIYQGELGLSEEEYKRLSSLNII